METESRESISSSRALDQLELKEAEHQTDIGDTDEERKDEQEEDVSVGNSVSMTPLLNLNSLLK